MPQRYDMVPRQPQNAALATALSALPQPFPSETPEPSLLKPILRHWWIVLLFGAIGVIGAALYLSRVQKLYTSYGKIYIKPTANAIIEALGTNERAGYMATQLEIMTSTPILSVVAENPEIKRMKTFAPANGNVVIYLQSELSVALERRNELIDVEMSSPYPEEAATIVDAVIKAYIANATAERDGQNNALMKTLKDQLAEEDVAIKGILDRRLEFVSKHPFASATPDFGGIDGENLKNVQAKYTEAELQLLIAKSALGVNHPTYKQREAQLADLRRLMEDILDRLKRHSTENYQLQDINVQLELSNQTRSRYSDRIHQIEMATTGRKLMEIDIIEPPRVADAPSFPRTKRTLAVAVVAGMLLGAGVALLRDRLDGRMRSIEEIQTVISLPILGVVPGMTGRRTAVARAMAVHLDPRSPVAEAYRTIRTAVYFGVDGSRSKTILVTSPEPGDGKTTSASNLAIAIAQTGRSVLLLDADFRKPSQHKNLEIADAVGMSSVLAGHETLERAIQRTGVEGLDILPCGPIPANPSEILNSREFGELVDLLAGRYDHIIFDSPPINVVTDARILAAVCDATILVLRADKSTKKAAEHARNGLLSVGARVLGAIVNGAPKKRGYEVYGGSYYGRSEPTQPVRRLAAPAPNPQAQKPRRRDIA